MSDREDETLPQRPDDAIQTRYSHDETPSEAVVRALAAANGVEPTEIEVLYKSIDPEALDKLIGDPVIGSDAGEIIVGFEMPEHRVVVRSDGRITILNGADDE